MFLFTDEPSLTAGDLGEDLKASPGSLSGAIKTLIQLGLLERAPVKASRREHYRMRDRAWTTLYSRQHAVIDDVLATVERGVEAVPEGPAKERLSYMRDFYIFLLAEVPQLIERFEQLRSESRP